MKLLQYTVLLLTITAVFTACTKQTISPRPKKEVHTILPIQYHIGATFTHMDYYYDVTPYGKDSSLADDTVNVLLERASDSLLRVRMTLNEVAVDDRLTLDSLVIRIDDLYSEDGEVHYIYAHQQTTRGKMIKLHLVVYWDNSKIPVFDYEMNDYRTNEYIKAVTMIERY